MSALGLLCRAVLLGCDALVNPAGLVTQQPHHPCDLSLDLHTLLSHPNCTHKHRSQILIFSICVKIQESLRWNIPSGGAELLDDLLTSLQLEPEVIVNEESAREEAKFCT